MSGCSTPFFNQSVFGFVSQPRERPVWKIVGAHETILKNFSDSDVIKAPLFGQANEAAESRDVISRVTTSIEHTRLQNWVAGAPPITGRQHVIVG